MIKCFKLLYRLTGYVFAAVTFRPTNIDRGKLLGIRPLTLVVALSVTKVCVPGNALHFINWCIKQFVSLIQRVSDDERSVSNTGIIIICITTRIVALE
jgi:hypothetical protein